jgi:hypothetical protein
MDVVPGQEIVSLLQKMLAFMGQVVIATKYLAIHHLHALAMIDETIRVILVKSDAENILEGVLLQVTTVAWADEEWSCLEEPLRQTLHVLQTPIRWFSMFLAPGSRDANDMLFFEDLCGEVTSLIIHTK